MMLLLLQCSWRRHTVWEGVWVGVWRFTATCCWQWACVLRTCVVWHQMYPV